VGLLPKCEESVKSLMSDVFKVKSGAWVSVLSAMECMNC